MLPATNVGVGMNLGFPDVCLTPVGPVTVPIPYPNLAMHAMAAPFSPNVMVTGTPALSMASEIPLTLGDSAGVAHPILMETGAFTLGNPTVMVNMLPGICLLCPTTGNGMNNPLGAVLVPSVTNVFYTHATAAPRAVPAGGDPYARELTRADLDALARSLASVGREAGPPVLAGMLSPGVGYLAIRVFSADVPARVFGAVRELSALGMTELVIDLRDDPGGELLAFVELAGDFLEPGSVVVTMVDGEGDETVLRSWHEQLHRMPLRILVNRGTASAAELFAGCLAAHGRATVEGEETYGKRVGQQVLSGGGAATVIELRLPANEGEGGHAS